MSATTKQGHRTTRVACAAAASCLALAIVAWLVHTQSGLQPWVLHTSYYTPERSAYEDRADLLIPFGALLLTSALLVLVPPRPPRSAVGADTYLGWAAISFTWLGVLLVARASSDAWNDGDWKYYDHVFQGASAIVPAACVVFILGWYLAGLVPDRSPRYRAIAALAGSIVALLVWIPIAIVLSLAF